MVTQSGVHSGSYNPIQLFVPKFRVEETLAEIKVCLEKGWTGAGFKTVEFEQAWCTYTGLPHAVFLNSATAGLHLALHQLKQRYGWQNDDEIITTPITFVSTNHAILYCNLVPVFADVDPYLCLDPVSVKARITDRTRAILFVGMGGNTGQYDAIRALCDEYGLKLILDAAHMAGTRLHGLHVGHDADVAVFSFQAVKPLPTADSGMICWPDEEMDAQSRRLAWLGIDKDTYSRSAGNYKWRYNVDEIGWKYNGNSVIAAIGLVALRYLDKDNAKRREIAAWYDEFLSPYIRSVPVAPDCESSRHLYQVMIENREYVIACLNEAGVFPGVHYWSNEAYPMYSGLRELCWNAGLASHRALSLPMHLNLTIEHVAYISGVLHRAG